MASIRAAIAENYASLSESQRQAADFMGRNRLDVATRSLRAVAAASGVSAATFSRLARTLGYDDYAALREEARQELDALAPTFSSKARKLQLEAGRPGAQPFLHRHAAACTANIAALAEETNIAELEAAADTLAASETVLLIGSLGSAGLADYLAYLASWVSSGWLTAGRNGVTLASSLSRLSPTDAVVIITKAPYASRAVRAAKLAAARGATLIVLTDSAIFPGAPYARHVFVQRTESPQFFSSYAATLALIETLAGMVVERAGPSAETRIQEIADANRLLEEFAAT